MTLLLGAWTVGLILSLLALGVFISFRVFNFRDMTADGSITLGACLTAVLVTRDYNPFFATAAAFAGGFLAGAATATLNAKFRINQLIAGILMMTALYTVNLRILGKSNLGISQATTLATYAESLEAQAVGGGRFRVLGYEVFHRDAALLGFTMLAIAAVGFVLYFYFRTNLGASMRATGDNDQMVRSLGVNIDLMLILGLALSNGLVALSGSLLAQYQGFADVTMGVGMVVWGLASIILGETLIGARSVGWTIIGAVLGSLLFRLLVALVLLAGLDPIDLRLLTAVFVFGALVIPGLVKPLKGLVPRGKHA